MRERESEMRERERERERERGERSNDKGGKTEGGVNKDKRKGRGGEEGELYNNIRKRH